MPGGSRIVAVPANEDTVAGFSANIYLDEFALHLHSRKVWSTLYPMITRGWKVRVTSTPRGKGNKFHELMTGKKGNWSKHIVDIHQAVKQGLKVNIEELKANLDDEDAWKQEYELKWLDEAGAWLSYDIINGVEHEQAGIPGLYTGQPVYVGNDIGLRRHLWALWVWEPIGDVLWTREIRTLARAKFADHDDVIAEIFDRYRVARLCMDQTSIGERSVEEMQSVHGEDVVEGVLFNPASKLYMAQVAKRRFQDKLCRIPEGDQKLRADLHKLKQDVTPAGNARFVADSDAEGHADRAWSGFLGMYAAENPAAPIEFQSAGQRAGMREMDGMGWESGMEITDAGFGTLSGMNDFRGYI